MKEVDQRYANTYDISNKTYYVQFLIQFWEYVNSDDEIFSRDIFKDEVLLTKRKRKPKIREY